MHIFTVKDYHDAPEKTVSTWFVTTVELVGSEQARCVFPCKKTKLSNSLESDGGAKPKQTTIAFKKVTADESYAGSVSACWRASDPKFKELIFQKTNLQPVKLA